jgi:hypothetical protein
MHVSNVCPRLHADLDAFGDIMKGNQVVASMQLKALDHAALEVTLLGDDLHAAAFFDHLNVRFDAFVCSE